MEILSRFPPEFSLQKNSLILFLWKKFSFSEEFSWIFTGYSKKWRAPSISGSACSAGLLGQRISARKSQKKRRVMDQRRNKWKQSYIFTAYTSITFYLNMYSDDYILWNIQL